MAPYNKSESMKIVKSSPNSLQFDFNVENTTSFFPAIVDAQLRNSDLKTIIIYLFYMFASKAALIRVCFDKTFNLIELPYFFSSFLSRASLRG